MDGTQKPADPGGRKPGTAGGRKPRNPGGRGPGKAQKLTFEVSAEAANRFGVHALMSGLTRSQFLERVIFEHLRRYVVSDRAGGSGEAPAGAGGGEAA